MYTERMVWMILPVRRSMVKKWLNHLFSSSGSLLFFSQLSCFFLHTWPPFGHSSTYLYNFSPRWILAQRPMGALASHIMSWCPLLVTLKESLNVKCLPCPKERKYMISWSFSQTGLTPSLFLPWLLSSGVHRRQSLAVYPVSVVYFHFREQTGGCL